MEQYFFLPTGYMLAGVAVLYKVSNHQQKKVVSYTFTLIEA
jgi:hypothetical protein